MHFLFLLFAFSLNGQTLDVLLQEVGEANLELQALEKEYLVALEQAPQIAKRPDPEAGVGVFPLPVQTRLGPQLLRLSATQMFPWFGVVDARKELELSKAKALFERVAASKLSLEFKVKKAWYQLYEIKAKGKIIERNIEIMEALERMALVRVESGKGSAADVLRVQLKVQEMEQELLLLENEKTLPTIEINQVLNRPLGTKIQVEAALEFAPLLFNKDTLQKYITEDHPMIRMFALQQNVAHKAIKLNQLNDKPSFGAGLDYIMVNKREDMMPDGNGRDIVQLRATVKIPIYKQQYEAKEKAEYLKIDALEFRKKDLQQQFMAKIEMAYAEHENARLKLDLYKKQIEITKAAIRILETRYSTEGNKFDELLLLEKELIDYDLKVLNAIVKSHLAKIKIEKFLLR